MQATFSVRSAAPDAATFSGLLFAGAPPQPAVTPNAAKVKRAAPAFIH